MTVENGFVRVPTSDSTAQNSRVLVQFGDRLDDGDDRLFQVVKQGTLEEIKDFLEETNISDHNKKDDDLQTVLQIAVSKGNKELVELLLRKGCWDLYALQLARALEYSDIVQLLIENSPALTSPEENDTVDSSTHRTYDVTDGNEEGNNHNKPNSIDVISDHDILNMWKVAVDANDHKETKKLVDLIQKRKPNSKLSLYCFCPPCRKIRKNTECCSSQEGNKSNNWCSMQCFSETNGLEEASKRFETCRILSSPAYILVTAENPIWEALEWASDLQAMARCHSEHREELKKLADRTSQLAVDLLATCNNDEEAELLFKVSPKGDGRQYVMFENTIKYKLLHDAVGLLQKKFVTHPTSQNVLSKLWLGSYYRQWTKWSRTQQRCFVMLQVVLMPFIFFLSIFKVPFAEHCLEVPLNRFVYAATSYSFFLAIVLADQYDDQKTYWLAHSFNAYDVVIWIWVIGHICKIVSDLVILRHVSYARLWWSSYDVAMITFFLTGAFTVLAGFGWKTGKVSNWHLTLMSQGFYAIAMTLACLRILQWLHVSSTLGPMVISLGKMIAILRRIVIIFIIIMVSFSFGIYTVYKNFRAIPRVDEMDDTFFSSYIKTLKILFWAILGKGEGNYASVPHPYQYYVDGKNFTSEFQHSFTVIVGYTFWSLFHIAVVIVLLNMVIAIMTHYYQIIQDNHDTEWKFARAKLRLYYIENNNKFPPPFNIISMAFRLLKYSFSTYRCDSAYQQADTKNPNQELQKQHQKVVKTLRERYLQKQKLLGSEHRKKLRLLS